MPVAAVGQKVRAAVRALPDIAHPLVEPAEVALFLRYAAARQAQPDQEPRPERADQEAPLPGRLVHT